MLLLSKRKNIFGLIGWLALCFAASAVGAVASIQAQSFYQQIAQPTWAPPSWLFGPVWTLLYAMMAVAAWLVWCCGGVRANRIALSFFGAQLALNALWSWLFFAWYLGALAFFCFGFLLLPPSFLSGACAHLLVLSSCRTYFGSVSHLLSIILYGSSILRC